MTFTSVSWFLFLPAVYLLFRYSADRWRWLVLLLASYGFYASFRAPYLLAVLLVVTGASYLCALRIAASQEESRRRRWLWGGTAACGAPLMLVKYLPALQTEANSLLGVSWTFCATLITVAVSYFTFQAISYLADIYLELEEPERHFGRYALYLAFFPKLLQGPIERGGDLLPQLRQPYRFDYQAMRSGLVLFGWGLFQKVVIADRLALYADQVYDRVHDYSGVSLILATYAYAFQIYYDFAGYTDMARGTARLFGVNLTENFNAPYRATSVADFWRRWHISFSRWILDYIFKPLQMGWRHWGKGGTAAALVITFLISGVWHGATKGFLVWGLLHGIYLASAISWQPVQKRVYGWLGVEKRGWLKWWRVFVTFNLVCLAWVFFRASTLADAWYVISHSLYGMKGLRSGLLMSQGLFELLFTLLLVASAGTIGRALKSLPEQRSAARRWCLYYAVAVVILFFGQATKSSFIYTKF